MHKELLRAVFRSIKGGPFAVTYWDGSTEFYGAENGTEPPVRLIINEKINLRDMLDQPEIRFGEAYMDKVIDLDGDAKAFLKLLIQNEEIFKKDSKSKGLLHRFMDCQKTASTEKQKEDIRDHYDLGNEFFKLWLDQTMSYSSAYFKTPDDSLEQAQLQKIDHILQKMQLKEGESLLDIGCGWGWLIIKAAKEYGVNALGITLSNEQEEEVKKRIKEEGVSGKVEVRQADYRDLAFEGKTFDKISSVGMFEHVGAEYIPAYFSCLKKMLKMGGLSLLHAMTRPTEVPVNPWVEKYIFPSMYIPSLREIMWVMPEHSFHVIDVESLRLHYARTTELWANNLDKVADQIKAKCGERFVRMWRLYLLGCSASFSCSGLDIHQVLFSKGLCNDLPLTREYLHK